MDATRVKAILAASVGQASAFPVFGGASGGGTAYLKLCTGSTAGSPSANTGTEITPGGSYTSPGISFTPSTVFGSATYSGGGADAAGSATISTGSAVSQSSMPAATIDQVELWDSTSGTKLRWWWGDLSSAVTTNLGDTLSFAPGNVTATLNL
jgi:hypothetical protein